MIIWSQDWFFDYVWLHTKRLHVQCSSLSQINLHHWNGPVFTPYVQAMGKYNCRKIATVRLLPHSLPCLARHKLYSQMSISLTHMQYEAFRSRGTPALPLPLSFSLPVSLKLAERPGSGVVLVVANLMNITARNQQKIFSSWQIYSSVIWVHGKAVWDASWTTVDASLYNGTTCRCC